MHSTCIHKLFLKSIKCKSINPGLNKGVLLGGLIYSNKGYIKITKLFRLCGRVDKNTKTTKTD